MRYFTSQATLAALLVTPLFVGCGREDRFVTSPSSRDADVVADAPATPWESIVDGVDGGAAYRLRMPNAWNGDLAVLAHGYVDPLLPVVLPDADFAAFSDALGAEGFAVAYSSYSENGWTIRDAGQRTHALNDVFTAQFGSPRRIFVGGQSMGGLVALDLAERFPTQYAGVLSFCGATGGSVLHQRYLTDVRALFDVFYRKPDPANPSTTIPVLPGDALHVERAGLDLESGVRQVARNAMLANDAGAKVITMIARTPVPFAAGNRNQMINSIADALFRHAREIDDIIARGHGGSAVGNADVVYDGAGIDQATLDFVNEHVQRFAASKFAVHDAEQYYEPDGTLQIPMVSLRTTRDPALPAPLNDDVYLAKLSPEQRSSLVTVKTVDAFGHCTTPLDQVVSAFNDLVAKADAQAGGS